MRFMDGFKAGMSDFGKGIATIVNSILLSFVYVIGVGLTSIIANLSRKHFLDNKISQKRESYWHELNLGTMDRDEYYRQF